MKSTTPGDLVCSRPRQPSFVCRSSADGADLRNGEVARASDDLLLAERRCLLVWANGVGKTTTVGKVAQPAGRVWGAAATRRW